MTTTTRIHFLPSEPALEPINTIAWAMRWLRDLVRDLEYSSELQIEAENLFHSLGREALSGYSDELETYVHGATQVEAADEVLAALQNEVVGWGFYDRPEGDGQ